MAISEQAAEASRRGGILLPDDGDNVQVAGILNPLSDLLQRLTKSDTPPQRVEPSVEQPPAVEPQVMPEPAPEAAPAPPSPAPVEESAYSAYKGDDVVGIDFNMSNINTSADAKERINQVSKEFAEQTRAATQGEVSLEERANLLICSAQMKKAQREPSGGYRATLLILVCARQSCATRWLILPKR